MISVLKKRKSRHRLSNYIVSHWSYVTGFKRGKFGSKGCPGDNHVILPSKRYILLKLVRYNEITNETEHKKEHTVVIFSKAYVFMLVIYTDLRK